MSPSMSLAIQGDTKAAHAPDRARRWWAHGFTLACLAVWWVASLVLPPYLIAGPVEVALRAAQFFTNRFDFINLLVSLLHVVGSVVIAFILGMGLALTAYYLPQTRLIRG